MGGERPREPVLPIQNAYCRTNITFKSTDNQIHNAVVYSICKRKSGSIYEYVKKKNDGKAISSSSKSFTERRYLHGLHKGL